MKIGIVVSQWYWEEITSKMLDAALKTAQQYNIETEIIKVPGSFDIPLGVKKLLKKKVISGVVTLGAIIKGETNHDEVIASSVADSITKLSLEFEKPVMLGITGPKMTWEQAIARIPTAVSVTKACIDMIDSITQEL